MRTMRAGLSGSPYTYHIPFSVQPSGNALLKEKFIKRQKQRLKKYLHDAPSVDSVDKNELTSQHWQARARRLQKRRWRGLELAEEQEKKSQHYF